MRTLARLSHKRLDSTSFSSKLKLNDKAGDALTIEQISHLDLEESNVDINLSLMFFNDII